MLVEALARMTEEETLQTKRLESLHLETESATLVLGTRKKEVAELDSRLTELQRQTASLEAQLAEQADTEQKLATVRETLDSLNQKTTEQQALLAQLLSDKESTEAATAQMKADMEADRQQFESTRAGLETATRELQRSRTERAQLDAKTVDVRSEIQVLTTSLAVKKSEIGSAERTLESLYGRVAAANERLAELEKIEERLQQALVSLKAAEKQRDAEEKKLVDLEMQRETLRREVITVAEQEKLGRSRLEDHTRRLESGEAQLQEVQQKADALTAQINTQEVELVQLERKLQATIDEEKAIRAGMPELNAEMTAAQATLQTLLGQRSEAESLALNLAKEAANTQKKLAELAEQSAALVEEKARRERELADLQHAIENQEQSIQKVLDAGTTAGQKLNELQTRIQEHEKLLADASEKHELYLKQLHEEEAGLSASIEALRKQHSSHESFVLEAQARLLETENRMQSLTQSGDRILSLHEATSQAEARRRDAEARLSQFSELELSLQVRLNSLQETVKKENQRLDQLRHEREEVETDVQKSLDKASRDAEDVKKKLANEIRAEEALLVSRMKERNRELLEKHEELKHKLSSSTEEQTIIFFAGDVIKRLDLVENLIQRYEREPNPAGSCSNCAPCGLPLRTSWPSMVSPSSRSAPTRKWTLPCASASRWWKTGAAPGRPA